MKKFLTYSVVVATIAWSIGLSAVLPAAAAYSPADGDLIKTASYPAVYYVAGGKKYLFVNRVTYTTWSNAVGDANNNFAGLKVVSQADFDAINLGGNVTARPGVSLVQFDNSPNVYAVTPGAVLVKLSDAAAKTALYGSAAPIVIQSSFEANYTKSASSLTATSNYPDGALISNGGNTYLVMNGQLQLVSGDAFTANMFKTAWVHSVSSISGYTMGSAVSGKVAAVSSIVAGAGSGTVITGSANVSLAADSPASGTIIAAQAAADLAHFAFSGTGTVTGLRLTKIGVAGDTTLSNVYLYDGAKRLTDAGTVSNGTVNFSNGSGLFTISGTKVITVKSDILASTGGQTVGVSVNAASDVTGVTIGGTFPVKGNIMSIASTPSDIATAVLGGGASITNVGTSVTAGTSNVTLWSDTLSTTQRNTWLKALTFNQIGSITNDSIINIGMFVDGTKVASGAIDSNGILLFDMTATPVSLNTGSHTIDIRGDVVKGSSRTFKLSLRNAADLVVVDSSYGVNIAPTLASGSFPAEPTLGSTTISAGTISVATDPTFNTTQIVSAASNQILGQWTMKAYGEDLKVMNMYASTTANWNGGAGIVSTEKINNYAIYVNGVQVGSSKTYTLATSTLTGFTEFGSTNLFTIPAGQTVTVTLKGDLSLASGTTISSLMSAIKIASGQVQGQTSFATTAVAADTTYAALNTLTIATGALTVAANSTYGNQTVAANQVVKIGSYILTAANADTVRVTNINIAWGANNTLGYATNTSDLYISENTGNKVSPQSSNNFSVDFTLQPNQSKTIDVFATVGSLTAADLGNKLQTTLGLTARTGSGASASTASNTSGQTITVNNGSLSGVSFATSTAVTARYVLGGSTVDKAAVYTIKSSNAAIILDEMAFHVSSSDPSYSPVTALIVNGTSVNMISGFATSTGMNLSIPAGYAGTNVVVKSVMNIVGQNANISGVGASTTLVYIKYHAVGGSPTTVLYQAGNLAGANLTAVASIPSVTVSKVSNLLSVGTVKLAAVNLGADSAGPVNVTSIALTISTSSKATTTAMVLKDANGTTQSAVGSFDGTSYTFALSNGGYQVGAGQSVTLYLYGTVAQSSAWGNAGTEYVTVGLTSGASFVWDDVNGNKAGLTGASIYGLSTDSVNITN